MQFITGNKFKNICDYILDEQGFRKTDNQNEVPIYFVKIDLVNVFFKSYKPNHPFKLITHNGDLPVSSSFLNFVEDPNLIVWYGQNIDVVHPKIKSIPIGIANEIWTHGDENLLLQIIKENNFKDNLLYCNFDMNTNIYERKKCVNSMESNGIKMSDRVPFETYLRDLSKSMFVLSPNGNGIDCHKLWESLYVKTIPIVTKSINVNFYKHLPIIIINNWDEFSIEDLTPSLYFEMINNYNHEYIDINYLINKIKQC